MALQGTIQELLALRNPTLDLSRQPFGSVTQDKHYLYLKPSQLSSWDDFSYTNIASAFGHLFDIGPLESDAMNIRGTPSRIQREDHVDFVTSAWCMQICRMPIKRGAAVIQKAFDLPTTDVSTQAKGQMSRDRGSETRARIPDWSIFLEDEGNTVLVWGDDKCSSKWCSDEDDCPDDNYIWPFCQMLTYCVNNNTRYGFILTPEEMVALRVHRDPDGRGRALYKMQYKSVPWDAFGQGQLTVNMAIWAITMMSINDGYRIIQSPEWTLPLNVWWKDETKDRIEYVHHLSGRNMTTKPNGADVRPRPSTVPVLEDPEPPLKKRKRTLTSAGPKKRAMTLASSKKRAMTLASSEF